MEIIFFVSVGGFLANGQWGYSLISLLFAMIFAGYTGKQIEKDAIERYEKRFCEHEGKINLTPEGECVKCMKPLRYKGEKENE